MRWKGVQGKNLAGDNPSQLQRILFDSEDFILSALTWHVMKKISKEYSF
jgi:hypothetical protein